MVTHWLSDAANVHGQQWPPPISQPLSSHSYVKMYICQNICNLSMTAAAGLLVCLIYDTKLTFRYKTKLWHPNHQRIKIFFRWKSHRSCGTPEGTSKTLQTQHSILKVRWCSLSTVDRIRIVEWITITYIQGLPDLTNYSIFISMIGIALGVTSKKNE